MLKLYQVEIEATVYVVAEDEAEAQWIASRDVDLELEGEVLAREARYLLATWRKCLPYGDNNDDLTCEEWLDMQQSTISE